MIPSNEPTPEEPILEPTKVFAVPYTPTVEELHAELSGLDEFFAVPENGNSPVVAPESVAALHDLLNELNKRFAQVAQIEKPRVGDPAIRFLDRENNGSVIVRPRDTE